MTKCEKKSKEKNYSIIYTKNNRQQTDKTDSKQIRQIATSSNL